MDADSLVCCPFPGSTAISPPSPTWTFEFGFDPEMGETLGAITGASNTILLGRKTHEMFAPAWRERTVEEDPGAPFFNDTEKLVVGANEPAEEWANTTPIGAYDPEVIRRLKQERDGVIYISGSGRALPRGRSLPRPAKVVVTFGPPLTFARAAAGAERKAQYEDASRRMMAAIAELRDESARGAGVAGARRPLQIH